MLFKQYTALTAGVLLFIVILIGGFDYYHAQIEHRFRDERAKFGVEHAVLTASTAAAPAAASSAPITVGPAPQAPESSPSPASTPAPIAPPTSPSPSAAPDTNIIIGPLPPPSSSTPAPRPSDPASTPMAPPSSTLNYPRENASPFIVLTAYHPFEGAPVETTAVEPPKTATPPAPAPTAATPSTNAGPPAAGPTNTATSSSASTNGAPTAASGPLRPAPVEASVIVLLYHQFIPPGAHVSSKFQWTMNEDVFESEMKYIHDNGYHVVPMSDLLKFLKHEIGLPPNSVVITIDDGYKSAIVHAAPILKKYGFPWTFFIYPQFITVNEGAGAASWNDLLALQAEGVDIESHSMTHPQLTKRGGKTPEQYDAWLTNETLGSKTLLEQKMGKPITCFAYPYGAYNKEVEAKAIAAGYEAIFTVADNPVHATTNLHSIGRYTITQAVERNFTAYLHQGALGIAEADPAPGATISNPRPVITAVLGYAGNLDAKSIETDVRDFGSVRHDYDPKTGTVRLYLPRDLIQSTVLVNIRVKDTDTGQVMVANWHFNYEPGGVAAAIHPPIVPATNATSAATNAPVAKVLPVTNAPATNAPATNAPAASPTATNAVIAPKAATPPATNAAPAEPAQKSAARQGTKVD